MKLSKKEKDFWLCKYNIKAVTKIPSEMNGVVSIDSEVDDEYLFYLTSRVPIIRKFDLENTNITNVGVKLISKVQQCESLQLIQSRYITAECLADINQMESLRILNLLKTSISLKDIRVLDNLKNLEELHISSKEAKEHVRAIIASFKKVSPGCRIFLNYDEFIEA